MSFTPTTSFSRGVAKVPKNTASSSTSSCASSSSSGSASSRHPTQGGQQATSTGNTPVRTFAHAPRQNVGLRNFCFGPGADPTIDYAAKAASDILFATQVASVYTKGLETSLVGLLGRATAHARDPRIVSEIAAIYVEALVRNGMELAPACRALSSAFAEVVKSAGDQDVSNAAQSFVSPS